MQAPFADPLTGLERLRTSLPLVGRDFEMQVMRSLLDTVALNEPAGSHALLISGEVGVGKTRLLAALCQEARERDFRVLEVSAYEAGRMLPYLPFSEALRSLIRSLTLGQLRRYIRLSLSSAAGEQEDMAQDETGVIALSGIPFVTALARLFPDLPALLDIKPSPSETLLPEQEKFRLFDAVATLLERAADDQPILLGIDNLQWVDSASLELMLYLTVRLRGCRVALVGVTRPSRPREPAEDDTSGAATAASDAAARILGSLIREGILHILAPGPLSTEAAEQHLQALLPGVIPQEVARALLERAEGNLFFLEELVRMQTLSHQLEQREGVWRATRAGSSKLPDSIIAAVRQRLKALSAPCLETLQVAALFGRTFPADALAQATEKSEDKLQLLIDEALQAMLIAPLEEDREEDFGREASAGTFPEPVRDLALQRYMFCQGIVQEVLYADMPAYRSRVFHAAIGRALEVHYGHEAVSHAAELVRHYALGGEREATLRWSLRAGEDAARQQAHREAIAHFRLALKLLEAGAEESKDSAGNMPSLPELQLSIGELWFRQGELDRAVSAFQQAIQQFQSLPARSPLLLARANRYLSDAYRMQARYDLALSHLQAASSALDSNCSDSASAPAQSVPWFPGRSFSYNLTAASSKQVDTRERILLLQSQATLATLLHRTTEAEELLWQSYQLATEQCDRGSQAFALHWVGYLRGWGEQIHEAIRLLQQAHELYVAIGDPFRAALGDQVLGIIYQVMGEMESARLYTLRGLECARRYGVRHILGWLHWNQGAMALTEGNWESSGAYLQQALQEASSDNMTRLKPVVLQALGELHFRRGNWRQAEQYFLESIQAATSTEWLPGSLALYGHFLAVTGRRTEARTQLERAADIPESPGFGGSFYLPFLAEGYLHLDLTERASTYIQRIRNLRGFTYYGNAVDRILGIVAAHAEDWETAERAFEEGLSHCQRAGNEPEEAAILYEQARAALMRGAPLTQVHALCERARALFLRYDMQRAVAMVDALRGGAAQLQQKFKQPPARAITTDSRHNHHELAPTARLTKRELEVLRLVAEGHTDREVADTLVISPRTANRHLSNIFVKLDVPGRAAAVAYAIRLGLV
jgi:DNA-binding CsgD family transcriptional regulator/tetratricopeptide (TPR) repeat protein